MKKEIDKQFEKNISFMNTLKRLIPFFVITLVIIWIISLFYSFRDIDFRSSASLIIFFIIMILIIFITGWIRWKMDIYFMNKKIKIMEKAFQDAKRGKKPSKLRTILSVVFLILALPVLGTFLLWLGISQNSPKATLLGGGLLAITFYALFLGIKNYFSR